MNYANISKQRLVCGPYLFTQSALGLLDRYTGRPTTASARIPCCGKHHLNTSATFRVLLQKIAKTAL